MNKYMVGKGTSRIKGRQKGVSGEQRAVSGKDTKQVLPPKSGVYANLDLHCPARAGRIDRAVCLTLQIRQPEKCNGCGRKG